MKEYLKIFVFIKEGKSDFMKNRNKSYCYIETVI